MTDDLCEVIITAPDAEWLSELTRNLVDDRLAASGHNISPIRSIYRWQGEIRDHTEGRVALHTRRSLVTEIVAKINREHPYQVPGVIALPILDGNPDYLRWIRDVTRAPSET
jgi:periplasmic divalent cation tolerance protein